MQGKAALSIEDRRSDGAARRRGTLIVNADDWGRDRKTTDSTLECIRQGSVSSVSAMVFMEDSRRAAELAGENQIDAGLHLNFTTPFSAGPARLAQAQQVIARTLRRHRLAPVLFHAMLVRAFEYVICRQVEEFERLYGAGPRRFDGHHHMHLCANVVFARRLPRGAIVRRNFSFEPGDKGFVNRFYRRAIDRMISRRHVLTDFFFALEPVEERARLERIFALARRFAVEVETHPANPEEFRFLANGEIFRLTEDCPIAASFAV